MFVPGGQVAGMGLMSFGADVVIQKATTGEVNWGQAAISGGLGMVGGGVGLMAGKLVNNPVVRMAVENGVDGAISGAGGYLSGPGPHTPSGLVRATAMGGGTGAVPIGGPATKVDLPAPTTKLGNLSAVPEGVVYHRVDELGDVKPYVGQAKSDLRYSLRQQEHARDFPDAAFEFTVLDRAAPGLELDRVEEYWIRKLGGPTNKGNPDGSLSNKRHQMSDTRYAEAGGNPW